MTITYSIWHGSRLIGHSLTASTPSEISEIIAELNKLNDGLTYTQWIVRIDA